MPDRTPCRRSMWPPEKNWDESPSGRCRSEISPPRGGSVHVTSTAMNNVSEWIAAPVFALALAAVGLAAATQPSGVPTVADREAVRLAALDYVEGIYEVAPDRIRRSVRPNLVKRGFYKKSPRSEERRVGK